MARITIACWGSHGDFDPSLGLGLGLQARGHAVTLATLPYFEPHTRAAGLGFHAIRPHVRPDDSAVVARIMNGSRGTEYLMNELIFPNLRGMYEDLVPIADTTDLFVSHPLTMAVPMIAELRGIPWASTVLAPISFFSATDAPVVTPLTWMKDLERFGAWPGRLLAAMARFATDQWARPVRDLRRSLGLPPGANPLFDGQHSPTLVLALYSRVMGEPQSDWPAHTVVTGPMFHDAVHGTTLAPDLERFLAEGTPPVLFTLGSSAVLSPGSFWAESLAAVRRLGLRAICLAGPGNVDALRPSLPDGVMAVEMAPHSLLMPRASVVVQQCGIGTLSQGLRSGAPMLAVPFAHDQFDNAHRAARLGVARIVPAARYCAPRVAEALAALTADVSHRAAAQRVAAIVRTERGVDAACDAIEERFRLR